MGFFAKDDATPAGGLEPVSNERLARLFDETGVTYGRDEDGDLGGYWDGHPFHFWHAGSNGWFFQVRGRWVRGVPESEYAKVVELVNAWSSATIWPKCYVEVPDGQVVVYAELTVNYGEGATDEQINLHVRTAVAASVRLFDHLDEQFPEHAAAAVAAAGGTNA